MSSAFPRKPIYPPFPDDIFIDDPPQRTPEAIAEAVRIRAHAERYAYGDRIPYIHAAGLRGPFVTNPWAPPEARKEVTESGGGKRVTISDTPSKGTQTEPMRSLRSGRRRRETGEAETTPPPARKTEGRRKRKEYTPEPEEEGDSDDSHIEFSVRFRNLRRKAKGTPASEMSHRPTPQQRNAAIATEELAKPESRKPSPKPSPFPAPVQVDLTKETTPTPSSPKRRKRKRAPLRPTSPERHHNVPLKTQAAARPTTRHQTEPPLPTNNSLKENEKVVPVRKRMRVDFDALSPAVVDMKRGAGPVTRGRGGAGVLDVKPLEMKPLETISPPAWRREMEVDEETITLSQRPPSVPVEVAIQNGGVKKKRKTPATDPAAEASAAEAPAAEEAPVEALPSEERSSKAPSARAVSARTPSARTLSARPPSERPQSARAPSTRTPSARPPSERPPSPKAPPKEAPPAETESQVKVAEEIRNNAVLSFIQENQPPEQLVQPTSAPAPVPEPASPNPSAETAPPPATVPVQPKPASPPPKTPYQSTQSALLSAQRRFLEAMGDSPLDDDTPLAARITTHHAADDSFIAPTSIPHPPRTSSQTTSKSSSKPPSKTGGSVYSDSNITSSDNEDDEFRPSTRNSRNPSARNPSNRNSRKPSRALNTYTQFTPFSRTTQVLVSPSPPPSPPREEAVQTPAATSPHEHFPPPREHSPCVKSSPPPLPSATRPIHYPLKLSQSRRPDLLPLSFDEPSRSPSRAPSRPPPTEQPNSPVTPVPSSVQVTTTPFPPPSTGNRSIALETPSFLRHPQGTTSTTVDSVCDIPPSYHPGNSFTPVNSTNTASGFTPVNPAPYRTPGHTSTASAAARQETLYEPVSFSRFLSPPRFGDEEDTRNKRDEAKELVKEVAGFMEDPWNTGFGGVGSSPVKRPGNLVGGSVEKREGEGKKVGGLRWDVGVAETDDEEGGEGVGDDTTMSFLSSMGGMGK